jgi:hypothetical protein
MTGKGYMKTLLAAIILMTIAVFGMENNNEGETGENPFNNNNETAGHNYVPICKFINHCWIFRKLLIVFQISSNLFYLLKIVKQKFYFHKIYFIF